MPAVEENELTRDILMGQIGNYPVAEGKSSLPQHVVDVNFVTSHLDSTEELYEGIGKYHQGYQKKVDEYKKKYVLFDVGPNTNVADGQFFRRQFVHFMAAKDASNDPGFSGDSQKRQSDPESAAITLKQFLGSEGAKLYQLALEEERNSKEYMNAVFRSSTTHFEGDKWKVRPVMPIGGPSGSGKTTAAKVAVKFFGEQLPKIAGQNEGNDVVAVDGGIARETSQMRKLVIQVANNKGYTGVKDLHSKSKVLEDVKDCVREAALNTESLGVVIPETFSKFIFHSDDNRSLLKRVSKLPNTKLLWSNVFTDENAVNDMAKERSYETNPKRRLLDLNQSTTESKSRNPLGYSFGRRGSDAAEKHIDVNFPNTPSLTLTNDLKRMKQDASGRWVEARPKDAHAIVVSERTYLKWLQEEKPKGDAAMPLDNYRKDPKNKFPPVVQWTAEIKLNNAFKSIRELSSEFQQEHSLLKKNIEMAMKIDKVAHVEDILTYVNAKDINSLNRAKMEIKNIIEKKTFSKIEYGSFADKINSAMTQSIEKMDQLINQLESIKQVESSPIEDNSMQKTTSMRDALKEMKIDNKGLSSEEKSTDEESNEVESSEDDNLDSPRSMGSSGS